MEKLLRLEYYFCDYLLVGNETMVSMPNSN